MSIPTLEASAEMYSAAVNAGDIDGLLALYEPNAVAQPPSGEAPVSSAAGLRKMYEDTAVLNPTIDMHVTRTLQCGEIALVTGKWAIKASETDGSPFEYEGSYCDVLRQQSDGTWKFIIENPFGTD